MKRICTLALVFAITAMILAGCGNTSAVTTTQSEPTTNVTTNDPSEPDLKGKTIKIGRWGGNDGENTTFAILLANFTTDTGIKTEEKVYTDFTTQIKADLVAGLAPDVFYVDAYMAPFFINQEVLAEIDSVSVEADKFYAPLIDAFKKDGKLYSVPKDYSTLALYYNTKWISAADIPQTREELYSIEYLDNILAKLPKGVSALTYVQEMARLLDMMQIDGTSVLKEDNRKSNLGDPRIAANIKPLVDAAFAKKIVTPADIGTGWNGEAFGNEKAAMVIEGNWLLGTMKTQFPDVQFEVVEIPALAGKKSTMVYTVGWSINSRSKEKDAALAWIKYVTGTKGMTTWCTGAGVLPSRSDIASSMNVDQDLLLAPHIAGAEYATPWQKGESMDIVNNEFMNYFNSAIKGEMTLEDMMKKAEDEANKQIQ